MTAPEQNKRPRRTPLTREEVEAIIAFKQRKEQLTLFLLKKTWSYKIRNVFLVLSFFVFCEVVFCYFGPCNHTLHYTTSVAGHYAPVHEKGKGQMLNYMDVACAGNEHFRLMVNDFKKVPSRFQALDVSSDFLMNCALKASIGGVEGNFRLFRASPVLLLCCFCSFILLIGLHFNLNQNEHTLWGLTVLCSMTLVYLICV